MTPASGGAGGALLEGLRLLVALADSAEGRAPVGELAAAAGIEEAAAAAHLREMGAAGFVAALPGEESYQLGPAAAHLADAFFPYAPSPYQALRQAARPALERALAASGENVFLSVRSGHELLYVDAVMPPAAARMVGRPGDRDLLHATSQGKALLAFLPEARQQEIVQYLEFSRLTARTIVDRKRFLAELADVRRRGFALQNEEREEGIRAVAAPVLDPGGYPVAAVCLAGPSSRLGSETLEGPLAAIALGAAKEMAGVLFAAGGRKGAS
jgi:DNA-binding IclR family transcriptional regulator